MLVEKRKAFENVSVFYSLKQLEKKFIKWKVASLLEKTKDEEQEHKTAATTAAVAAGFGLAEHGTEEEAWIRMYLPGSLMRLKAMFFLIPAAPGSAMKVPSKQLRAFVTK